jgi:Protein of unknown function (DUF3313)
MTFPARSARPPLVRGVSLLALAAIACSSAPAPTPDKPPQQWDGLERRASEALDNVYVRPNVQFSAYKSVRLDPVNVEFDEKWDPNQGKKGLSGRITTSDIKRIREDLATSLRKVLVDTLAKGGYPVVEGDGEDVLRVTASLVDVYINAPGKTGTDAYRNFTMESGRITLFMELRDSVTGQVLARAVDTSQGNRAKQLQWTDSVSNSTEAQQVFGEWATQLRRALDAVNAKASPR